MKPAYASISLQPGSHNGGLLKIQVAPKEWLSNNVVIDFNSGKVLTALTFSGDYDWLTLEFTPDSYDYEEKAKTGKSGPYCEVNAAGVINYADAELQQVLETLKYSQFVCLLTDRNKNIKLVGNKDYGMILQIASTNTNKSSGQQFASASLYIETEIAPPFYDPI